MQYLKIGVKPSTKKIINCIAMLTMLFAFLWPVNPGIVSAADKTSALTINDNEQITTAVESNVSLILNSSTAEPGDTVTASGTTDANTWVSIKVLDNNAPQNIVFFDGVKSGADGTYSCTFKVPFAASGNLTVVTGRGSNVATESLNVSLDGWWPEEKTDVAADRVWNIKFSKAVKSPLLLNSIYVAKDMNGNNKVTGIAVNPDRNDLTLLTVGPPAEESWEAGETYYLFITTDIKSTNNDSLNPSVRMKFKTASDHL